MNMVETKGPRPYHVASLRTTEQVFAAARYAADWRTPRYPGDSIAQVDLVKGDEMGDVRVQWYGDGLTPTPTDKLKVGTFLPGIVECSPGDTPKCWPEKSEMVASKAAASRLLIQYLIAAFRDGWSVKK